MKNLDKYKGVIPAFYACYDKEGNISPEGVYKQHAPYHRLAQSDQMLLY